jgi:hypothetical protein
MSVNRHWRRRRNRAFEFPLSPKFAVSYDPEDLNAWRVLSFGEGQAQKEVPHGLQAPQCSRLPNQSDELIVDNHLTCPNIPQVDLTTQPEAVVPRQNSERLLNQAVERTANFAGLGEKIEYVTFGDFVTVATRFLNSRRDLLLENLALRQQLAAMTQRHPPPRFSATDRIFWVVLRRLWSRWKQALILVQPATVIRWHRTGFNLYWKWISRKHAVVGRKPTSQELRELIFRMVTENRTWGAPRIHGELRMLGFDISERTVLRWMRKVPRDP